MATPVAGSELPLNDPETGVPPTVQGLMLAHDFNLYDGVSGISLPACRSVIGSY